MTNTEMKLSIERATPNDLSAVLELLRAVSLPADGVHEHLDRFLVARSSAGELIGSVAVEQYGSLGLLRSLAVHPSSQKLGLGLSLTNAALEDAKQRGIVEVLLLTTTAQRFFETKFGFQLAERSPYDTALSGSKEWNLPRCSSAVLLRKEL